MKHKTIKVHKIGMTPLVIFVSLLALIFISMSYMNYNASLTKELEKNATDDLMSSSNVSKKTILRNIDTIFHDMRNIITTYEENYDEIVFTRFLNYLSQYNNKAPYGVLSYVPESSLRTNLNNLDNSAEYRSFIENILNKREQVYISSSQSILIQLATPVLVNGEVQGCVINTYDKNNVEQVFVEPTFNGDGTALVVSYYNDTLRPCIGDSSDALWNIEDVNFYPGYSLSQMKHLLNSQTSGMIHYKYKDKSYYAYITPQGTQNVYIFNIVPSSVLEQRTHYYIRLAINLLIRIIICFLFVFGFMIASQAYNSRQFKRSHDILALQQKRYDTILKHTQGSIWEFDIATETLTKTNPDLGIYSGLFSIADAGRYIIENQLIYPDDLNKFKEFYENVKAGAPEINTEIRAKDISGEYVWFELIGTSVTNQEGAPITVIGQTNNINEKKQIFEELEENAKRDSLTKLYNRRSGVELINNIIDASSDDDLHALFMIDVDNFKGINDTYGHTFGDAVLLELSAKMQKTFRGEHVIARFGGDEFIAFLSHVPTEEYVKSLASKISNIFSGIVANDSNVQKITGSIGISLYPKDGTEFNDLFQKADMALYYSKSMGKNCYSFYTRDLMSSMNYLPSTNEDTHEHYLHTENRTVIDSSILANTVDILCDAKQLSISINLVLNLIGNYYELDYLCIYELSEDNQYLQITFDWASDPAQKITNYIAQIPIEIGRELEFYQNSSVGIFYHNDALSLPYKDSEYSSIMKKLHRHSLFQCGIREQGQHQDFIEAVRNNPNRNWTKVELDTLTMTAKVIGSYLLKLRTEETATELTKKDLLTRSNNLFSFVEEATKLVTTNSDQKYVLLYCDINNFKHINESYGYSEGDRILRAFSDILDNSLTDKETYGRINADKFIALLSFENDALLSIRLSDLNVSMNNIKKTQSDHYKISIIMGLYRIQENDIDLSACIDRANIARKSITDRHKTKYAFFDESMKSRLLKQKEVEDVMEEALKNHEFLVYYQPKFNLETNKICGAEALVRWQRDNGTVITPNNFIPIFEDNGFIVELDFYVLEQVCQKIRTLLNNKKMIVPISVNFSRMHLRDRMLVPRLTTIVKEYNIPPRLIEVEITESALVEDNNYLLTILQDIHNNGFKLSMDDFGSGLSSLNLLRKLPFDVLKLDKDFFQKGTTTQRERTIIQYIVKMALDLNMEIVSEGVETEEQAQFLRSIKCPIAQGYLYERPLPEKQFVEKYCK